MVQSNVEAVYHEGKGHFILWQDREIFSSVANTKVAQSVLVSGTPLTENVTILNRKDFCCIKDLDNLLTRRSNELRRKKLARNFRLDQDSNPASSDL